MVRSELVDQLAARNPQLTRREVDGVVDIVLGAIIAALADGRRVELRGFGAFSTRARDERTGRNPRTGSEVAVAATVTGPRGTEGIALAWQRNGLAVLWRGPLGAIGRASDPDPVRHVLVLAGFTLVAGLVAVWAHQRAA